MAAAAENTDLPRALVSTIIKNKLASTNAGQADEPDKQHKVNLNKDALLAFVESAKIFISYLTATANDICHESKRQIINVDDVFNALQDIDFGEFVEPLKDALDAFREESKEKNAKKAERTKKRKQEEQAQAEADEAEAQLKSNAAVDGEAVGPADEVEPAGLVNNTDEVMADAPTVSVHEPVITEPVVPSQSSLPLKTPAADASIPTDQAGQFV